MTIHVQDASGFDVLNRALRHQVISEIKGFIALEKNSFPIEAARLIMRFILVAPEGHEYVELNVGFIEELVQLMILFVNALIRERVLSPHATDIVVVDELNECDSFLRSLRALQKDLSHRLDKYAAELPELVAENERVSGFEADAPPEYVIEKCLVKGTPCLAYHWISVVHPSPSIGGYMHSIARLIAYQFVSASQLDSFYIGVHILRNAGEDVDHVLSSIGAYTSLKSVRDRIFAYLGTTPPASLRAIEASYSNHCYETQLNRQWTRALDCTVHYSDSLCGASGAAVPTGNIRDTLATKRFEASGKVGSISTEDSKLIHRKLFTSNETHIDRKWANTEFYLHMTLAWMEEMSSREIAGILADAGHAIPEEFRVQYHKDRNNVRQVLSLLPDETVPPESVDIYRETFWRIRPGAEFQNRDLPLVHWLSRINGLLSPGARHVHDAAILNFFAARPQVLQLYLARFSLGETPEAAAALLAVMNPDPWVTITLVGRLGNAQLPAVSRLMREQGDFTDDKLVTAAEWMFNNDPPPSNLPNGLAELIAETGIVEEANDARDAGRSFKQDISLDELLGDVFGPNYFAEATISAQSNETLVNETEYWLSQGRPTVAHVMVTHGADNVSAARRVALHNVFQNSVAASAVSFLELLEEPTETLRVDIQAARVILLGGTDESTVIRLFLSFNDPSNLLAALKLLEEAAWAQEESPQTVSTNGGFESPWHLVALFCRVHNLPRSLTLLHELARNGDWVMFLHESDLQQCPLGTVSDVIRFYFAPTPLRSHLNILVGAPVERGEDTGRCPGLIHLLSSNEQGWENSSRKSYIVSERRGKIFHQKPDPKIVFARYCSQFRFAEANRLYQEMALDGHVPPLVVPRSALLRRELADIHQDCENIRSMLTDNTDDSDLMDSLRSNLTASSPSMVHSIITDDDDEEVDMEFVQNRIEGNDFFAVQGFVKSVYSVSHLVDILLTQLDAVPPTASLCLAAVSVADLDYRELLGDQLMARDLTPLIVNLAYSAYSSAFILEEKFDAFIDQVRAMGTLPDLIDIPELGNRDGLIFANPGLDRLKLFAETKDSSELGLVADELDRETRRRVEAKKVSLSVALGATIQVSQLYLDLGLYQKHLHANAFAQSLLEIL